jgi:hypothetical protein
LALIFINSVAQAEYRDVPNPIPNNEQKASFSSAISVIHCCSAAVRAVGPMTAAAYPMYPRVNSTTAHTRLSDRLKNDETPIDRLPIQPFPVTTLYDISADHFAGSFSLQQ